jgi:hypothetical protein
MTTKEFFTKNKTAICVGSGLLVAGTASYIVFFREDENGRTLWNKWTKKGEGREVATPPATTYQTPTSYKDLKNVFAQPVTISETPVGVGRR